MTASQSKAYPGLRTCLQKRISSKDTLFLRLEPPPSLDLRVGELGVVLEVLQDLRLQLAVLLPHGERVWREERTRRVFRSGGARAAEGRVVSRGHRFRLAACYFCQQLIPFFFLSGPTTTALLLLVLYHS